MGKLIALLCLGLAIIGAAAVGVGWWQSRGVHHQLAAAVEQASSATVAAGQADARTQALRIVVAGAARDRATAAIQTENRNALLQAPGADQLLDPDLVGRARIGLCRYDAYHDDPECAGLLQPDPVQLPAEGQAGPFDPGGGDGG